MKIKSLIYMAVAGVLSLSSCNKFLDEVPDNRVDPQTPDQLLMMMVDGYSFGNYAKYCELSSDNIVDNNSPDKEGVRYNLTSAGVIDDEMFAWEDAKSDMDNDSPSFIWEGAYHAIAVSNHVLDIIKQWEDAGRKFEGTDAKKLDAARGEAYLIRAYNHFVLVNVFCKAYGATSASDPGIPYVTEPERTVNVHYERGTVAETYAKIEEDLKLGLKYVNDNFYEQTKYHFNKKAANAFAARFYLFKREYDKVVNYADVVLGAEPSTMMRTYWGTNYSSSDANILSYVDAKSPSNLLLIPTYSSFWRSIGIGMRYGVNRDAATETLYGQGPTWSNTGFILHPCMIGKLYVNGNQDYGVYFLKLGELFEYTDKVAGIGYVHMVRTEFTAEETLLCRAEAKIYLKDFPGAVADLKVWDESRQKLPANYKFDELTPELVEEYYDEAKHQTAANKWDPRPGLFKKLNIDQVCPSDKYAMTPEMAPYLQCLRHFRRIETIFDGYRWFDIKRYGIEVTHKIGRSRVEVLTINDPRRALQLPSEVIAAGIAGNVRKPELTIPNAKGYVRYSGGYRVSNK